jgi:hypothetical protein
MILVIQPNQHFWLLYTQNDYKIDNFFFVIGRKREAHAKPLLRE